MDVQTLDGLLLERAQARPDHVQQAVHWYQEQCSLRGLPMLEPRGLPLRPLVLPHALVHSLEHALGAVAAHLQGRVPASVPPWDGLAQLRQRHISAGHMLPLWRPDLRPGNGGLGLLDLNVGTPAAATIFETDLLRRFYLQLLELLGLDPAGLGLGHRAAVGDAVAAALRSRFPDVNRVVALDEPSMLSDANAYDGQLAGFLEGLERALGAAIVVCGPTEAALAGMVEDQRTVVLQLNTVDFTEREVWERYRPLLSIPGVEHRWWTSPFGTTLEKHLLPELSGLTWPAPLHVPGAMPVTPENVPALLEAQPVWVVKHGRNLKRVLMGRACAASTWRDGVTLAAHLGGYVAQRLVQQTPCTIPVWQDGAVHSVDVEEEYSPFVLDGKVVTFFVRYLPLGSPSMVVSPPPSDLGLGVAWSLEG